MHRILISIIVIIISLQCGLGQVSVPSDKNVVVYLKDGSAISGQLVEWTYGEEIIIESQGITLIFPDAEIKKVVEQSKSVKIRPPVIHKNKGLYYTAKMIFMVGNDGSRAHHKVGYGVSASTGYQWNQYIGAGIGLGYRQFVWDSAEDVIPVFAEVRGFFGNNVIRPHYNVEIGYAFAKGDSDLNLAEAKGGMTFYPSFGISVGRKEFKTTVDLGYNFQKADFTYSSDFDDRVRSEQRLTFRRLSVRLGFDF